MDVEGGWIGSGYSGEAKNTTIVNKMMLRFRPIAPKPTGNTSATGSTVEIQKMEVLAKRRTKRKYVRVKNISSKTNKKEKKELETVVTLQLLPESSGGLKRSYQKSTNILVQDKPIWMNHNVLSIGQPNRLDPTAEIRSEQRVVVESWVMVDGITSTLVDFSTLGSTDMEKMKNLDHDTCPGFISDRLDSVTWVNVAYRRMIDPGLEDGKVLPSSELKVWLVMKEERSVELLSAFACIVRIVYYTRNKEKQSRTMPCDVWKMDFGGFAWRFDAKAALSLGP